MPIVSKQLRTVSLGKNCFHGSHSKESCCDADPGGYQSVLYVYRKDKGKYGNQSREAQRYTTQNANLNWVPQLSRRDSLFKGDYLQRQSFSLAIPSTIASTSTLLKPCLILLKKLYFRICRELRFQHQIINKRFYVYVGHGIFVINLTKFVWQSCLLKI